MKKNPNILNLNQRFDLSPCLTIKQFCHLSPALTIVKHNTKKPCFGNALFIVQMQSRGKLG